MSRAVFPWSHGFSWRCPQPGPRRPQGRSKSAPRRPALSADASHTVRISSNRFDIFLDRRLRALLACSRDQSSSPHLPRSTCDSARFTGEPVRRLISLTNPVESESNLSCHRRLDLGGSGAHGVGRPRRTPTRRHALHVRRPRLRPSRGWRLRAWPRPPRPPRRPPLRPTRSSSMQISRSALSRTSQRARSTAWRTPPRPQTASYRRSSPVSSS